MAYVFPLTTQQFFSRLPIEELVFDIPESVEIAETGGGELLPADLGTRLWTGEVRLGDMTADEAAEILPLLDILRRAAGSFMAYDKARPGPRADVNGLTLGASSPKLHTVATNSREIRLSGLPAGYLIQPYDYLAFAYGTAPVRYALHRVASAAVASGAGLTPLFEVSPNLRPGWTLLADVTLVRAACKCLIVPGSVQPGRRKSRLTTGVSFRFQQTLR